MVTALYLFGYWGSFGLNVLEYIGIGDIVSHALMPFLASIVSLAFGAALSTISRGPSAPPPPPEVVNTIKFVQTYWRPLAILDGFAIALVLGLAPEPERWFLAIILIIPLTAMPTYLDFFIDLLPNPSVRSSVIGLSILLAALAFAEGRLQADHIVKGTGPLLVDVVGSGLQLKSDAAHPVSYVGHIEDFFVLYDSEQSQVVILNAQKVTSLTLLENPKAAPDVL